MRYLAVLVAAGIVFPLEAAIPISPPHNCFLLGDMNSAQSGVVVSLKARFYSGSDDVTGSHCPAENPICIKRSYLLKADHVLLYQAFNGFTCAVYPTAKSERPGWLLTRDVAVEKVDPNPLPQKWIGTWLSDKTSIIISRDRNGQISISGDGMGGPAGDNMANFQARAKLSGGRLYFRAEAEESSNFSARLVGDFLIISQDEHEIGGEGVRFGGEYVRSAR